MTYLQGSPGAVGSRVTRVLWLLWPWMSWLLPFVLLSGHAAADRSLWDDQLRLAIELLLIIPAFGLLGSLPRFIMRKRGYTRVPAPLAPLLIAQWWSMVFYVWAVGHTGADGVSNTTLGELFGVPDLTIDRVRPVAGAIIVICWLAQLLWAVIRPAPDTSAAPRPAAATWRSWVRLLGPAVALVFTPLLIIAIAAGPIGVSAQDESAADQAIWNTGSLPDDNSIDPGGLAKEQAGAVTDPAVSRQRQEEAWGHMQRSIVPLRSALADDGWVRAGHRPSGTVSNLDGQYSAEAAWMLRDPSGTPKALLRQARDGLVASSAPLIRSSETDDELKLEASTADGVLITVEIYADSDRLDSTRYVYVSARGPAHWSEGATVDWSGEHTARELEVLLGADPEMPQPRFAADEWPELSLEMTPLS